MLATGTWIFASLSEVNHPARRLLRQYKHRSAPVVLITREWSEVERLEALKRGPHKFATKHAPFLCKEFALMVEKVQWVVLPY